MPFRTKHTYSTSRGTYNTRKHSFTGSGPAPAGMHKAPSPTINDVAVTTTYPSGRVVRTAPGRPPVQLSPSTSSGPDYLSQINDLLTPGPTVRDTAEAAARLGVKPKGIISELASDVAGPAGRKIAQGIEGEAAKGIAKIAQAAAVPLALKKSPKRFGGHKVLGTPTLRQLLKASAKGQLRTNRRGRATIRATRHAARDLAQARRTVGRSGRITGITHGGEAEQFAETLAKNTRLNPRFVGAWVQAEGGGYAAGGQAGKNNWLGVGYPGQPTPFGRSSYFSGTGAKAGRATADWIKGKIGDKYGYGAAPGIEAIIPKAAGKGPQAALRALRESGWGTNVASVAQNLPSIGTTPANPAAVKRLQNAKLVAQRLGIPTNQAGLAPPPKQVVTRFKAALVAAHELDKAQLPYVWGGGHNTGKVQVGSGVDCSGAVSFVLQKMGVKLPGGVVSGEMGRYLEPGPGAVTIFYNAEHTFMKIGDKFFGTSHANPGRGAGFIPTSYEEGEAKSGKYNVAHVPGLGGKVALEMGIDVTSGGPVSGGGISYGPEGTTATVTGGTTKDKPGFSSSPILFSGGSVSPLLATTTPLPSAYRLLQGESVESGTESPGGIIAQILRRKTL